jgi:hypothetical protein
METGRRGIGAIPGAFGGTDVESRHAFGHAWRRDFVRFTMPSWFFDAVGGAEECEAIVICPACFFVA